MKINIPYKIRVLLSERFAINILNIILFGDEKVGNKTKVYLPLLESSISEYFRQYYLDYSKEPSKIPESVFKTSDCHLIEELTKNKLISSYFGPDENDNWFALTENKNKPLIKKCYQWALDVNNGDVINYGIFSLHLFTGEAYCLDDMAMLTPSRGLFHLFRRFLEHPKHTINHKEIIYYRNINDYKDPNSVNLERTKHLVYENIKDLKDRLKIKGKLTKLIVSVGNAYKLLPGDNLL